MTLSAEPVTTRLPLRFTAGDAAGGIGAAMVVLPQAMAYGIALFALMGLDAAQGAFAGLLGAVCLNLVSGAVSGTRGLVSSPTGPSLALLAAAVLSLQAAGVAADLLLPALMLTVFLAGLAQIVFALAGGGRLIKFLPYPVVVGFMTGAALLMLKSQVAPVAPTSVSTLAAWIPAATAVVTYLVMVLGSRGLPAVPATIPGLVAGVLTFHLLAGFGGAAVPERWLIGALPGIDAMTLDFSPGLLAALPLAPVIGGALALGLLASLNTLLASVVADLATETRHNARRELLAQGTGQALAGVLGGIGGSGTTGATVVAVQAGARRWAGLTAAAALAAVILFGGSAASMLPVSVLAGIIIHVALGMLKRDMFEWLRSGRTRIDAAVAMTVTAVTVIYDLVTAVGVGVALAVLLFLRAEVKAPVIHRRSTAAQRRSVRKRTDAERELLAAHGDDIVLYELRGNITFASADRLYEEIQPDLERPAWVILHMRRVSQVDLTGINILHQIATRLHVHGGQLAFCEVHHEMELGEDIHAALVRVAQRETGMRPVLTFMGSDEALEAAENALLTAQGSPPALPHHRIALAETDLCEQMRADQVAALEQVLHPLAGDAGRQLFAAGEPGDDLFIVASGEVEVRLQTTQHHYKRLAKYGPGTFFGEVAFLDPGPRSANAIVTADTQLLVLDRDGLERLERERPDVAVALLVAIGKVQGHHLRHTAEELQRMAQW